jgi:hypothetical protein
MNEPSTERPAPDEYAPYYLKYVDLVQGNVMDALTTQIEQSLTTLAAVPDADSLKRYAPGKWSLREVVGHIVDAERIFAYRALRFGRGDSTELEGFDQDPYVASSSADSRPWAELLAEFELVRRSNVLMFGGFDRNAWLRRGKAIGNFMSVRAIAYNIAGHELHHMRVIRERYLQQNT